VLLIRIRNQSRKPDPNLQNLKFKARNGAVEGSVLFGPIVAELQLYDEDLDLDQSEKRDPDPNHTVSDPQHW
jgi:hypothetical protein